MSKLIEILNCDIRYGIGKRNGLLFHLPNDMAFFRLTTSGHTVVMGENTLLSFPGSKPLPKRKNVVLSQDPTHEYEGVINVHSWEDFLQTIKKELQNGDVYVIGGASIYRQMLPYCDEVLLTKVNEDGGAEVFFENLDANPSFVLVKQKPWVEDNGHSISFCTYQNQKKAVL